MKMKRPRLTMNTTSGYQASRMGSAIESWEERAEEPPYSWMVYIAGPISYGLGS